MVNYSVDKVKLRIDNFRVDDVQVMMNKLAIDSSVYHSYESNKMAKCRYNYLIGEGEGAIYVGVAPNWIKEEKNLKSIVLEYNPNKVFPWFFESLELVLWSDRLNWCVMSVDIACDIYEEYSNLVMLKRDKREYFAKIGHSEVETQYLGKFGDNGHIKFYNKAKERKVDAAWSRFEITLKGIKDIDCSFDRFRELCKLPVIYFKDSVEDVKVNDLWLVAFEGVLDDIDRLYKIENYRTRKKMENLLAQALRPVCVDVECCFNAFVDFFNSIFDFTPREGINQVKCSVNAFGSKPKR